jgi:hypothetical protein
MPRLLAAVVLCLFSAKSAGTDPSSPSLGVIGLGSNVVDRFYRVRGAEGLGPIVGQKGYFSSEGNVVGGVTLNHLAWARCGGRFGWPLPSLACTPKRPRVRIH